MAVVGNFLFILGVIAIISTLVTSSNTSGVVNSLSNLLTNSIKAAKG